MPGGSDKLPITPSKEKVIERLERLERIASQMYYAATDIMRLRVLTEY